MRSDSSAAGRRLFLSLWTPRSSLAALALLLWTGATTRALGEDPPYVVRGRQVEARQRAFQRRLERFHQSLSDRLRKAAPDLLLTLEPPTPKVSGYRILPRLVPDAPPKPPTPPQVVSYSWRWSDTLIAREMATLDRLETELAKIAAASQPADRAAYESLVADYKTVVDHRRAINADIDYNWLWQARIARDRPLFDRLTAALNAAVERQARGEPLPSGPPFPSIWFDPPGFVRLEVPADQQRTVTVPFYTDIEDADFVAAFRKAVEDLWRVREGGRESRVLLTLTLISPARLYCGRAENGGEPPAGCAPPGRSEKIDLATHIARFPKDGAVLTTGAASLQLSGARAIVLGPHDIAPHVLAH